MPNANGKIYSEVVNGVKVGIGFDEVSSVLGDASKDEGTLCTSGKINPAAIFRPRFTANNPGLRLIGTDGKFLAAANTEIAAAISQKPPSGAWGCPNLGIWVPEFVLRNLTSSAYSNMHTYARNTWTVPVPDKDGVASFKIIDHFDGYDSNAKFKDPIVHMEVGKKSTTTNTIQIQLSTPSPVNQPGTISVGNMFGGKGWYFGAVVFRGTHPDAIQPSDTMMIFGSGTAIRANDATTVTITKDDAVPSSTTTYYYRIIPFVCNRANVTSALDTTFYSIHMSDTYPGIYSLGVGGSASGGGVKDYSFLWSEPSNMPSASINATSANQCYPVVNGNKVPITPATYHPGIVATFHARPSGMGTAPLKDMYSRVDFTFSFYVNGKRELITYTWRKSGALSTDNVLTRETSKDNIGGFEDYLFFSVANAAANILNKVSDPSEIELTADFYYADGINADYGLWGTWVPDNTQ